MDAKRDLTELGVKSYEESLRTLAGDVKLKEALSIDDREKIHDIFRKFLAGQYGIYAIQWVEQQNRYGYLREQSC
jgi:hypothetical protein